MADNLLVKDGNGVQRTLRTTDSGSDVHIPHHNVFGPVTDTELRATPVPVSGPVTDTQLRNSPVPVVGPATNAELRATPLPVSGPVTDTQLRNSPVPVSGPVSNAELRAAPVSVSPPNNRPISSGVFSVGSFVPVSVIAPSGTRIAAIYPRGGDVRFAIDFDPTIPVEDALGSGAIAKANHLQDQLISAAQELRMLSPDLGSAAEPILVDVSFFGVPFPSSI